MSTVPHHHFACPADWSRLPAEHRQAILAGYRARHRDDEVAHWEAMGAAIQWYRDNPAPGRAGPRDG